MLGAACKVCPWGALADILKTAMRPYGYELQICYNCSQVNAPRIVGDRKMPPPLSSYPGFVPLQMMPAPPNAPVWGSSSNYATGSRNLSTSRVQYAAPKVSAPSLKS